MGLFSRRGRRDDSDDPWTLAQGVIDGQRVIVRSRRVQPDPVRPVKVTITIGLVEPDEDGLPGPADLDFLIDAEESLFTEMQQHSADLVLVVSANHAREFVAYCSSHEWLQEWGPSVLARWGEGRPGTGVEAVMEPDWATYRAFAS